MQDSVVGAVDWAATMGQTNDPMVTVASVVNSDPVMVSDATLFTVTGVTAETVGVIEESNTPPQTAPLLHAAVTLFTDITTSKGVVVAGTAAVSPRNRPWEWLW